MAVKRFLMPVIWVYKSHGMRAPSTELVLVLFSIHLSPFASTVFLRSVWNSNAQIATLNVKRQNENGCNFYSRYG